MSLACEEFHKQQIRSVDPQNVKNYIESFTQNALQDLKKMV